MVMRSDTMDVAGDEVCRNRREALLEDDGRDVVADHARARQLHARSQRMR